MTWRTSHAHHQNRLNPLYASFRLSSFCSWFCFLLRQLQNLVGHIPQPKAVRGADALAGVRDLTPPLRAGASPPSLLRHLRPPPSSPWLQWDTRKQPWFPRLYPPRRAAINPRERGCYRISHRKKQGGAAKARFSRAWRGLSPLRSVIVWPKWRL